MILSACWIAKNEEANIARSLDSVGAAVDEMIVVDTGSTDDTAAVARAHGATIVHFEWIDDFAAAKNFALEQAKADVVLFLDADEWLDPALTKADREEILRWFDANPKADGISVPIYNVDSAGALIGVTAAGRILRRREGYRYRERIHEHYCRPDASPASLVDNSRWRVWHDGYRPEIYQKKVRRNTTFLESALAKTNDKRKRLLYHGYLLREYHGQGELGKALAHYRDFVSEPKYLEKTLSRLGEGAVNLLYSAIQLAADCGGEISPREVERVLVAAVRRCFPRYRGAPTIQLYFETLLAPDEDKLLRELPAALTAARSLPESAQRDYCFAESRIQITAAEALLRRGDAVKAMDYALAAVSEVKHDADRAIRVLLDCFRGQPAADIVAVFDSVFGRDNPEATAKLAAATLRDGYRGVFVQYQKRLLDLGLATHGDYLYLLLVLGSHKESVAHALSLGPENAPAAAQHLFLTAVCTGDQSLHKEHSAKMGEYAGMLEAFFSGAAPSSFSRREEQILRTCYPLIAFAADVKTADRLGRLFGQDLCAEVRAAYNPSL